MIDKLELLHTLRDAIIAHPSISMGELAKTANISRATLYRHYETREVLIESIAFHCLDKAELVVKEVAARTEGSEEFLREIMYAIAMMGNDYFFIALTEIHRANMRIYNRTSEVVRSLHKHVDQAKSEGVIEEHVDTRWIPHYMHGLIYSAWHSACRGTLPHDKALELAIDAFFNGIKVHPKENAETDATSLAS